MTSYELTLVLAPDEKEADKTLAKVKGWVEAGNGKITKTDKQGLKDFAYPIKKSTNGLYILMMVDIEPENLAAVDRRLRIEPAILRYLTVKI